MSDPAEPPVSGLHMSDGAGIVVLSDRNTTVAYCRYAEDGEIEYLFVQAARRRQGLARWLLRTIERRLGTPLRFRLPLSPAGRALAEAHARWTSASHVRPRG